MFTLGDESDIKKTIVQQFSQVFSKCLRISEELLTSYQRGFIFENRSAQFNLLHNNAIYF